MQPSSLLNLSAMESNAIYTPRLPTEEEFQKARAKYKFGGTNERGVSAPKSMKSLRSRMRRQQEAALLADAAGESSSTVAGNTTVAMHTQEGDSDSEGEPTDARFVSEDPVRGFLDKLNHSVPSESQSMKNLQVRMHVYVRTSVVITLCCGCIAANQLFQYRVASGDGSDSRDHRGASERGQQHTRRHRRPDF